MDESKKCSICGAEFIPTHGNKRICPECDAAVYHGNGRKLPRRYSCPVDIEVFEAIQRKKNIAAYRDTIVAIGYADRQMEATLKLAGRVNTEL